MKIRHSLLSFAVTAVLGATAAKASTVDITSDLPGSYSNTVDAVKIGQILGHPLYGFASFPDTYKFTVGGSETLTAALSTTGAATASEKLYESVTGNGGWTEIAGGLLGVHNLTKTVTAGEYYKIVVSAIGAGATSSYTLNVSAVPLPAALPLFASALLGIGAVARRRARKAA